MAEVKLCGHQCDKSCYPPYFVGTQMDSYILSVRITNEAYEWIQKAAMDSGAVTLGEYLRSKIMGLASELEATRSRLP